MAWLGFTTFSPAEDLVAVPIRVTAPTLYPVTLDELKSELQILDDDSVNGRLKRILGQAADQVERDTNRVLMTQTWKLLIDRFPAEILLPKVPVQSVSFIKYTIGGVLTTLDSTLYQTDFASEPCRIRPILGRYWPYYDPWTLNAVQIQWIAGYTSQSLVPPVAKAAVLYAARQMYYGCSMGDGYWDLINRVKGFGFV